MEQHGGAAFLEGSIDAVFSGGEVYFDGAGFSRGTVDFGGAGFSSGTVDFRLAVFSGGEVDFRYPMVWSQRPAFSWKGAPPDGLKLPSDADVPPP